ncbi:hypothetical protein N658DRAFT_97010 [Parathielavia hyrcaniae]|uniref:non-specific serine/threonine protein kinase n=1 Tax=Parathielavia hyrcaniae TaxID=113614 RepID=A0AAN6PZ47_9PEZI|nr:hypothetical protein N658DRAFT_97010 [Parathielavia hyrcaniae]
MPTMTPAYSLYKPLPNGRYLVRRTTDGELLLAQPLDSDPDLNDNDNDRSTTTTDRERMRTLLRLGAGAPAAALLNHENLVSIYDELVAMPLGLVGGGGLGGEEMMEEDDEDSGGMNPTMRQSRRMLVYNYCDMGTLQDMFDEHEPQLRAPLLGGQGDDDDGDSDIAGGGGVGDRRRDREKEVEEAIASVGGFFPESFVWHVALGLLRALQWLHEGVRDTYGVVSEEGGRWKRRRGKGEAERDWMPVLHRDLRAANVFLQAPRGVETFAPVKLGNFGRCWVSGAVAKSVETPVVAMVEEDEVPLGLLRERTGRWKRDGFGLEKSQRPYTRGSELFAVGAMLYEMMCGRPLPPADECPECACVHITANDAEEYTPCDHDCVKDVNIQEVFKPLFQYTADLKELVMHLLRLNRADNWYASTLLDYAWPGFENWAAKTEDGRLYRDTFDNIWLRKQNLSRLRKRRRDALEEEPAEAMEPDVLVV